jgi:hypothetical protein
VAGGEPLDRAAAFGDNIKAFESKLPDGGDAGRLRPQAARRLAVRETSPALGDGGDADL